MRIGGARAGRALQNLLGRNASWTRQYHRRPLFRRTVVSRRTAAYMVRMPGPIYLRVTDSYRRREYIGPYASIRAADGAVFAQSSCLGAHVIRAQPGGDAGEIWQEISFVTSR